MEYDFGSSSYSISSNESLVAFGLSKRISQQSNERRSIIQVYDLFSGKLLEEIIKPIAPKVLSSELAFSYDAKYIVSAGNQGNIIIWDIEENSFIQDVIVNPDSLYECVVDRLIPTTLANIVVIMPRNECGKVMFWDIKTNSEFGALHIRPVGMNVHLLTNTLATSDLDVYSGESTIQLWNIEDCHPDCDPFYEIRVQTNEFGSGLMYDLEFSPSGNIIAGIIGEYLVFFDIKNRTRLEFDFTEASRTPMDFLFLTEDKIAVLNDIGEIVLFDYPIKKIIGKVQTDNATWISFLNEHNYLLSGGNTKTQIWEIP